MIKFSSCIQLLLINLWMIKSILIRTDPRKAKYCYSKYIHLGNTINFSFVISADDDETVNVSLTDNNHASLLELKESNAHDFRTQAGASGNYHLCFFPRSQKEYYLSFEFFSNEEKGHTLDLAEDTNIHEMKNEVKDMAIMLEEMETNLKFILDRRTVHHHRMAETAKSLQNISFAKVLGVLLITIMQILIIQRFFGNIQRGKNNFTGSFEMGMAI